MTNNSKITKRVLLLSVLSMLLCVAMLVGSTFAWFTDSVVSGANKIVAGNLDIELEYATFNDDGTFKEWVTVESATTIFDKDALWEPGHTEVAYLRVRNAGTLALKYQLQVTPGNETPFTNALNEDGCLLSESLVYGDIVRDPETDGAYADRNAAQAAVADNARPLGTYNKTNEKMLPKTTEYVALVVYMPTKIGNEANYRGDDVPSIDLGVTLSAIQTPYEEDSFNNQYDKSLSYPVMDVQTVIKDLKNGKKVILGDDIVYDSTTIPNIDSTKAQTKISKVSTLDLGGKTITFDSIKGEHNFAAFYINSAKGGLTVNGKGTIDATATTGASCFHLMGNRLSKPKLIINDGTYIGTPSAVHVEYGTAYINGGFFNCRPVGNVTEDQYRYTLNCDDENYVKGYAKIIVTGGTFVNFNPADNQAEGEHTNFVAEGYKVVSETQENGDIWYTVIKA